MLAADEPGAANAQYPGMPDASKALQGPVSISLIQVDMMPQQQDLS